MPALNHDNTKVVLITNGNFPKWGEEHSIANVKANEIMLQKVMVEIIGVPKENIYTFYDETASHIQTEFQKIINDCSGKDSTLIVYYAGHGIPVSGKGLYWATFDTTTRNNKLTYASAIPTSAINEMLENDCNAERKILIADCCYAAEFLEGKQGDIASFIEKNVREIKGTFYMFSSDSDSESTFPADKSEEPTFFTNALVLSIQEGIEPVCEYCTIGQLFTRVEDNVGSLKKKYNNAIPIPYKRINGNAENYVLYKNPKYQDASEIELNELLANPNKGKIVNWVYNHRTHSRTIDALKALKEYESAETEIKNVKTLPPAERPARLLELAEKNLNREKLMRLALDWYLEEDAKPTLESAKSTEPVIEGERQGRQANQQVPESAKSPNSINNESNKWGS